MEPEPVAVFDWSLPVTSVPPAEGVSQSQQAKRNGTGSWPRSTSCHAPRSMPT